MLITALYLSCSQEAEWARNAAGRDVSHKFGYGVIDAGGLVELAQRWNNVPEQITCEADEQVTYLPFLLESRLKTYHRNLIV